MVSNITLGQYVPGKSFLHRMDARVKIVLIIAFIVLVFVGQNYPALGIVVVSVLGVMAFSNVPVKLYFKSLRMIIFVVILTAGLNLFYGRGEPLWQFGFMTITEAGITNAGAYMRKMALNGYILHVDLAPVRELVSLQRRCANNLNQVAVHANTFGVYPEEIAGLQRDYEKLWGQVSDVLMELSALVEK